MQTTPERQTIAPTWATIKPASGYDITVNQRNVTESVYTVTVNLRPGFAWDRSMFITSRFGNMDIINIYEDQRKRTIKLTGVKIEGSGSAGSGGQLMTAYKKATSGSTSITFTELIGKDVLLAFRDGILKWVVDETPDEPNQMEYDKDTGTFSLMEGDIFGTELITALYRT